MSRAMINELVAGGAGVLGLGLFAGLILRPAWTSYSRLWERVAAAVLSLYVLDGARGRRCPRGARRRVLLGLTGVRSRGA